MERLSEKLRLLRQRHSLTTRQLAEELGLKSYGHVSDIENGRTKPSLELLEKLARLYHISYDQLLKDELDV